MSEPAVATISPGPTLGRARIDALDALRGFALAGVCVANLPLFASRDVLAEGLGLPVSASPGDRWAEVFLKVVVEGRFMTLFSIMFGLGIALMASRIAASGRRSWTVLVRRLGFLAAVGFLHATYIWSGDVLLLYGSVGLLCLPLILRSTRLVWRLFWVALGVTSAGGAVATVLALRADLTRPPTAESAAWLARLTRAHLSGEHLAVLSIEGQQPAATDATAIGVVILVMIVSRTAWLFAAGVLAHRYGLIHRLHLGDPLGRRVLAAGLAVGVPSALLDGLAVLYPSIGDARWLFGIHTTSFLIGGAFMCAAYAVLFLSWWRSAAGSAVAVGLRSLGRVAFSAYLTQSLLGISAFTLIGVFGWSLWGALSGVEMIAWALGTVALQCVLATWWLRRFSIGPLEGLWRGVTYWRRPRWAVRQG